MATWSRLLFSTGQKFFKSNGFLVKTVPKNDIVRCMGHHNTMVVTPTNWQWHTLKNWGHFYFFVGAIPVAVIIFCANVFVGPATLEPIPEGYIPKQYEYHRSPISRFFAKYFCANQQQEYEKYLHLMVQTWEYAEMKQLNKKVRDMVDEKQDYRYFNFRKDYLASDVKRLREHEEYNKHHQ